jgi:WD40 repeat protein
MALGSAVLVAAGAAWWLSGYRPVPDARIVRVAISPSGRWLAAASGSGIVSVIAAGPGMLVARVAVSGGVCNDLQFAPADDALAIAGRSLWVWKFHGPELPRRVRPDTVNYGTAEFDGAGDTLLTVTGEGLIERIEVRTGTTRWSACCTSVYGEARYAPGGRTLVHGGHYPSRRDADTGAVRERLIPGRSTPAYGPVAFDPVRGQVCFGSQDGTVLCRDTVSMTAAPGPPRQPGWVESLAFSVDGERAVLAVKGAGLRVWDRLTGTVSRTSGTPASNVALSGDGSSVVFGTADGRVEFRNARTGDLARTVDCR